MAKKRRQKIEKKEDYVFQAPEMNKNDFIRKEMRNAKATVLAFIFAIFMGFLTFGIRMALDDFRVAAIIGLFSVAALPFIYNAIKLDQTDFEKKNWLGVGAIYIFTWLMISIVMSNPPITDIASPEISEPVIEIWNPDVVDNVTVGWEEATVNSDGEVSLNINQTFRIVVDIVDNGDLDLNSIRCDLISPGQQVVTVPREKLSDHEYSFEHTFTGPGIHAGSYQFWILASDSADNEAEAGGILILQ